MSKIINERGNKYNFLTVIDRAQNDSSGRAQWLCQCDCGKMVIVKGSSLRNGKTKSCGCYQKIRTSEVKTKDLVGQTIGNFTVLESIMGTKNGERHKWRCKCNLCGNMIKKFPNRQVQEMISLFLVKHLLIMVGEKVISYEKRY